MNTFDQGSSMGMLMKKSTKNSQTFSLSSIPTKRKADWPFLYYQDSDGEMKHNPAVRTSVYASVSDVGEALL